MFPSFFPKPKLFFSSFVIYAIACVLVWYWSAEGWGSWASIGQLFGFEFPAELSVEADNAARETYQSAREGPQTFWFYQYFLITMGAFCAYWMLTNPHPWQRWSVLGSALIFFVTFFTTQLSVLINEWYGDFYDLVQRALAEPNSITLGDYYSEMITIFSIVMPYIMILVLTDFFISHFVFRWRTAMNNYYMSYWDRLRHIEGAAQRVQEDTMQFARIVESLGVSFLRAVMILIAFLPILWTLSNQVKELPLVGEVPQGLLFVAILWSVFGTLLLAAVGIRLPGLEFNNQKVEAAYRKELVYGEDYENRADPVSVRGLFSNVRRNYFRLYFNYLYFNVVRYAYLQVGNLIPLIALAPTIVSGAITFGFMQRVLNAFNQVEGAFQYLINSWTTVVSLISIYKRLQAFEATIAGEPIPTPGLPGAEPQGPERPGVPAE